MDDPRDDGKVEQDIPTIKDVIVEAPHDGVDKGTDGEKKKSA